MRWTPGGRSDNIEDRRGVRAGMPGMRVGLGGLAVLVVLSLLTGRNFLALLDTGTPSVDTSAPYDASPEEERLVQFVSFVLDDVQNVWKGEVQGYHDAKLVLFTDTVRSACGFAESAMGPFYCPVDEKAYIDLGFYDELRRRFGAPGDFAQAYVLAHEIGHHVQHLLGTSDKVRRAQEARPDAANALSVRLELQADCYAGVWAHSTERRDILERGDVEEALGAAAAVGDDRIQRRGGAVNPETFTHGSARQRTEWFKRGLSSGRPADCDTFAGDAG
ncbi:MAG TPA: neutral zinc metallopeptidase [Candidatus Binatia bacterium]|nr:neutral zinc metallopeptidase [Candidatus Binatia bacterium]